MSDFPSPSAVAEPTLEERLCDCGDSTVGNGSPDVRHYAPGRCCEYTDPTGQRCQWPTGWFTALKGSRPPAPPSNCFCGFVKRIGEGEEVWPTASHSRTFCSQRIRPGLADSGKTVRWRRQGDVWHANFLGFMETAYCGQRIMPTEQAGYAMVMLPLEVAPIARLCGGCYQAVLDAVKRATILPDTTDRSDRSERPRLTAIPCGFRGCKEPATTSLGQCQKHDGLNDPVLVERYERRISIQQLLKPAIADWYEAGPATQPAAWMRIMGLVEEWRNIK